MPEKYKRRIKQSKGNAAQQMNKNVPFLNIENANKSELVTSNLKIEILKSIKF